MRWKRLGAERIRKRTEGMTRELLLASWKERELEFEKLREERRAARQQV